MKAARALGALAVAACLAACAPGRDDGVVLWHAYADGPERAALVAAADAWNHAHPTSPLHLAFVPYDAFADKLTSAIPNGNGPDLFIYGNDRIADWAQAHVVESISYWIDVPFAGTYQHDALDAMAYRGDLYGLPLAMKSVALFYRTDLVATPPRTTDELLAMTPGLRARGVYPLVYANVDLYGHAAWLHGFGGHILDAQGAPTLDDAGGVQAAAFAKQLVDTHTVPPTASGAEVSSMFQQGKAAMAISGPWLIDKDFPPGVPWRVTTLPTVSATGQPAAPLLGVEGVLMSARAHDRDAAWAVMRFLTDDTRARARATTARDVVPNPGAYDTALDADPMLSGFRAQAAHAVPMPTEAALRLVWTPYQTALGDILAGRSEPAARLRATEAEVKSYLGPTP